MALYVCVLHTGGIGIKDYTSLCYTDKKTRVTADDTADAGELVLDPVPKDMDALLQLIETSDMEESETRIHLRKRTESRESPAENER